MMVNISTLRPHETSRHAIVSTILVSGNQNLCSNLNVNQLADFEQVFWIHNHLFAYVDPPYIGPEGGMV